MAKSILKHSLNYGLIAGAIIAVAMTVSIWIYYKNPDLEPTTVWGYASMILAFTMMFVGVKNYRDKVNGGTITFGGAFKIGLVIALVGSTIYVVTWLILYYGFMPDYIDKYIEAMLKQAAESGASAAELAAQTQEMAAMSELLKNPLFMVLMTYMEILPVGLIVALISALALRRKPVAA
jgi:Protein of unknown function (DUF4199)